MEKVKKLKPSQYYKKIILGLGDKVYSREELENRILEIDSSLGLETSDDKKNHGCHVSAIMRNIKEAAPGFLSILSDDATKGGMICYQITNATRCANKAEKFLKEKEEEERKKACEYAKRKYAEKHSTSRKPEKTTIPPELAGRRVKPIELPKAVVKSTGEWTPIEHVLVYLIAGIINIENRGLGEGDLVKTLHTQCGISTTAEDIKALVKREPNLEYNAHSGVIIRLKRDDDGTTTAAWENIKRLHGPQNIRRILIVRTDLSEEFIRSLMIGCEVTVLSEEKMVGTVYQISVSGLEDDLNHAALLYGRLSERSTEFMACPEHPGYLTLVKNKWGKTEALYKKSSVRSQIESEVWLERAALSRK